MQPAATQPKRSHQIRRFLQVRWKKKAKEGSTATSKIEKYVLTDRKPLQANPQLNSASAGCTVPSTNQQPKPTAEPKTHCSTKPLRRR